jgi:hypothetical protein
MVNEVLLRKAVDTAWTVYLATHRDVDVADGRRCLLERHLQRRLEPVKARLKWSRVPDSPISTGCPRTNSKALPLDAIRRPRNPPIWNMEAALKCRSCRKGRYAPPGHMIKLAATQEVAPDK